MAYYQNHCRSCHLMSNMIFLLLELASECSSKLNLTQFTYPECDMKIMMDEILLTFYAPMIYTAPCPVHIKNLMRRAV
jgi:hypothetical protein